MCFTSQHESPDTLGPALHGCLHQSCETVTVPPLGVQTGEVVEQVVTDEHMTCRPERQRVLGRRGFLHISIFSTNTCEYKNFTSYLTYTM